MSVARGAGGDQAEDVQRPLLVIGALLVRFVFGCNDDQEDDPRLQPFLKMNVTRASVERAGDGQTELRLDVVAEVRKKTYHCSTDGTALSCSSQDPDDECHGTPPDFGPHWGEEAIERVTITKMTAEVCADDGTCDSFDAEVVPESPAAPSPYPYTTSPYPSYVEDHEWESIYRVMLPSDNDGRTRIHVQYRSATGGAGTRTFEVSSADLGLTP